MHVDEMIAEKNDPINFLNYLKRFGSCLDYGHTPTGFNEQLTDISGVPRYNITLAFTCSGCRNTIPLRSDFISRTFPNNGNEWLVELAEIKKTLPYNQTIKWTRRYDKTLELTIAERLFDIHSAWRKKKLFGGEKGTALLNCLKCNTVNIVELDSNLTKNYVSKNLRSVPLKTIELIRGLEKELWREFLWPIQEKYEHFTIGEDFTR